MRLYGYVATKEELLDFMLDEVYGEILSEGPFEGDWRAILAEVANRARGACKKHGWLVELLGGRPHVGPNSLAYLEAAFAALHEALDGDDIDVAMMAIRTVHAYAIGAIRAEFSDVLAGRDKPEWQEANWPYIRRLIETGRFPMLAKIVESGTQFSPDEKFEEGLNCVLLGIGSQL
jgi:hypothetical protein